MSKGKWKKGKRNPKLTYFIHVTITTHPVNCAFCKKTICAGNFFYKISPAFVNVEDTKNVKYWYLCFDMVEERGYSCIDMWAKKKLQWQIRDIKKNYGYDPTEYIYAPRAGGLVNMNTGEIIKTKQVKCQDYQLQLPISSHPYPVLPYRKVYDLF